MDSCTSARVDIGEASPYPGPFGQGNRDEAEQWEGDWNHEFEFIQDKLLNTLETIVHFTRKYRIMPKEEQVFEGFRLVPPAKVRVVFIGQSPYPGICSKTGIPFSCGPAFLPSEGCATEPMTLRIMMSELCRDLGLKRLPASPRTLLMNWMSQGVMLLNASLTLGTGCPKHLQDHGVLWEEFMRDAISHIVDCCNCPVFVLIGREAWKFEDCVKKCITIKVSHPVARGGRSSLPWMGSGVFSRVSAALGESKSMWIE